MQPCTSAVDLRDAQALAYALSCQCSELSGPYELASKNLNALHNTLEEISEVFDSIHARGERSPLDQAVGECRRVLKAIDHALEYQDRQPLASNAANVKFTARIEVSNKKLLDAYEFCKQTRSSEDVGFTSMQRCAGAVSPQRISRISWELDGATVTPSSSHPVDSSPKKAMATSALDFRSLERIESSAKVGKTVKPKTTDLASLTPVALDSWKSPFALADPMSSVCLPQKMGILSVVSLKHAPDIETASYLILAGDMDARPRANTSIATNKKDQRTVFDCKANAQGDIGPPSLISSRQSCSSLDMPQDIEVKPKYRVVNADPFETQEGSSGETSEDNDSSTADRESNIPKKNIRRSLRHGSMLIEHKRMARVFDQDYADSTDSDCHTSASATNETWSRSFDPKTADDAPTSSLGVVAHDESERIAFMITAWNAGDMNGAQVHLRDLLDYGALTTRSDTARRMRHLLGVIASLNGKLKHALVHFISVLGTPLGDAAQLDAGDCAAAYWMGDIYSVSGRRTEALIAYSLVEQSLASFEGPAALRQQLLRQVQAEQRICRDGNDKTFFEIDLDKAIQYDDPAGPDSILNPEIMTRDTAQSYLDLLTWTSDSNPTLGPNQSRVIALSKLNLDSNTAPELPNLQLDTSALAPSSPWPMPFDPLFASANIACGLSLSSQRDLLLLKDVPRTGGALGRSRLNCFTCQDLRWLITTLRACMKKLELKYTELANSTGTWFVPQYSSTEGTIASTNFISISIFRLTFRSGYGVEICPSGIFSSRIISKVEEKEKVGKGGQADELKRIKKLIRSYLDAALKRKEAIEEMNTVIPVMSINGVTSIHRPMSARGRRAENEESSGSPGASSSRSGSFFS